MFLFDCPYNWHHDFWKNIGWIFYSIKRGVRNLRWFPIIWQDEDFDWYHLAKVMEAKFRWMAKSAKHWNVVSAEKDRKRFLICAELLKRMMEDDPEIHHNNNYNNHEIQMKEYQKQLGQMISKYFMGWWD
jgi:hypothetical protein